MAAASTTSAAMNPLRATAKPRQSSAVLGNPLWRSTRLGGAIERVDRARLTERVVAAEERLLQPADGAAEIVGLEPVAVGPLDRDPLRVEQDAGLVRAPRRGHSQRPVRADDLQALPRGEVVRAVDLREHVAGEDERPDEPEIDAGRADDLPRGRLDGLARQEARAADAVAPDVHERAAGERRIDPSRIVDEREREGRPDETDVADRAAADELEEPRRLRMVAPHERLHQQAAVSLCGGERALDLGRVARERLLAQHVLARLERTDRPLHVRPVRERDVHDLDVGIREQRLIRAVRVRNVPLARVRSRALLGAARDRDELAERRLLQPGDDGGVDPRCRQQAPADPLYPHESSVIGRNDVVKMRIPRGRVSAKTTTSATSSAVSMPVSTSSLRPRPSPSAKSVATPPGAMHVQRMPRSRSSWSSERMKPTWPNFD